jgi:hypothetical protein
MACSLEVLSARILYTKELQKVSTILKCFHCVIDKTVEAWLGCSSSQIMTCLECDSVVVCLYQVILA